MTARRVTLLFDDSTRETHLKKFINIAHEVEWEENALIIHTDRPRAEIKALAEDNLYIYQYHIDEPNTPDY